MLLILMIVPLLSAFFSLIQPRSRKTRLTVLVLSAIIHNGLVFSFWVTRPDALWKGFLALDDIGLLFLSITSTLFTLISIYGVGYLTQTQRHIPKHEALLCACLSLFLSAMTLVTISQNLELIWVAIEATTLSSAPLIYFHRSPHSLEATWKYFMICSVGIALALLGNFFLAVSTAQAGINNPSMLLSDLIIKAPLFHIPWLKAAFLFLLVGYGTKMGLAPFHTWLPDAHSEAPSFVSALLSGALLNCAFVGILRVHQVCVAAGLSTFTQTNFQLLGLLSMAFAAAFILNQADYKRMLAYSSVEHMGILSLSIGLGGGALFGGMFHAVNHSLTKAMLFLLSGNILIAYRSRLTKVVSGMRRTLPYSSMLWLIGFFAITGIPPFGTFVSKLLILKAAFEQGQIITAILCLVFLALIFVGMVGIFLKMVYAETSSPKQSEGPNPEGTVAREPLWSLLPPLCLAVLVLLLGIYMPPVLKSNLESITLILTGP
ncbi:MAG: NADH dehydrogenase FAD-containing subunit [Deltaproteobacteria bacterium]|nr:NADH dehydrogenase FAD-containing subunit [Deltaproteobacteria bacterium]